MMYIHAQLEAGDVEKLDFDTYAANVRKVTPEDVQRVAKQYLGVLRTVIVQPQ